jgi:hypothetical protein
MSIQRGKKRSRVEVWENAAATAGEREAAALHWMRTGEKSAADDVLEVEVDRVRELLRLEAEGLSDCGACRECIKGGACIRAANRRAALHGNQAAWWAEEGGRLIGRTFEV